MELNFYSLSVLYLVYSFLGWVGETVVATVKGRRFANRGVASGPFCFIYGFTAVLLAISFADRPSPLLLFLGCAIDATVVEWLTAKLLGAGESPPLVGLLRQALQRGWLHLPAILAALGRAGHGDGPVGQRSALQALRPAAPVARPAVAVGLHHDLPVGSAGRVPGSEPLRPGASAPGTAQCRAGKALRSAPHPAQQLGGAPCPESLPGRRAGTPTVTAQKTLSFADLLWLFVIGAFLGDIVETLFCRVTAGVWMSRSSLVWGPFSVVWGLALALSTVLLRNCENKSDSAIFAFGVFMGGAYEYVCSAVGELLFGVIFWDYSSFKFNIAGRVNLLYCFFWGIAAVVWLRLGYPLVAKGMDLVRRHVKPWMTILLAIFMAVNMSLSGLALARYNSRTDGITPRNQLEVFLDEHFDNARMERVYPNAKKT